MGEVYRARDPRLGRDVAIKILPESFAADPDRLRRFEQEARAVGALNHPNILSVHDIGAHGGIHYMVTELLEGETLREKLGGGALSYKRAVEYGVQITHGLSAAHEKGIVHRDLKPENLFITKDARVKILDFGLAKQATIPVSDDAVTLGSTANTSEGIVLGTVGYMAPEQVRGEGVDPRTDIFAFGVVLYEMLSGQRPFRRSSSVETMAAILREEPPEITDAGDRHIPPGLERIVRRCLEKSPGQRFQSAKDLSFALENLGVGTSQQQAVQTISAHNRWRLVGLITAAGAIAVLAVIGVRRFPGHAQQPKYQQVTSRQGFISGARFAPDGQNVVFAAAWDHPLFKLYNSRLDGTDSRSIDLPPSHLFAVSRSGELATAVGSKAWTGVKGGRLARAPLAGGAPRELLENVGAADWSPDGTQLAVARFENGKCKLEYPIGKVLYETLGYLSSLRFSPQADSLAFMDHPLIGDDRGTVVLVDLKGNNRTLTPEWSGEEGLAWSPDGKEVWFTATNSEDDGTLYAVSRLGKQRVILRVPGSLVLYDVATDGRVLLTRQEKRYEVAVAQIGGGTRPLSWLTTMVAFSISRDGKFAVIGDEGSSAEYDTYLANLDGSPAVLLGKGEGFGISPDNKWVTSILPTDLTKVLLLPTGVGETKIITAPNLRYSRAFWSRDGRALVVTASESGHPARNWMQSLEGSVLRAITPEGIDGILVTVNQVDYISVHDVESGRHLLYPINGGTPKAIDGLNNSDEIVGGAPESEVVYVSPDVAAVPLQISKVNIKTGLRQSFVNVTPADPAGVVTIINPIFTIDEKRYVYTQIRVLSVLYVASGLK